MDQRAYIEERSIPEPNTGCWVWMRSIASHGYGNACVGNGVEVAHRVSYRAFNGPITPGALVQHSCDNHWCVAPHHLSLGTDKSNAEDKQRKGRASKKLTARDVRAIRDRTGPATTIAEEFGVHDSMINRIRRRLAWKHVA